MTKKAMIQKIQALEAAAFLETKQAQKDFGKESELHQSARSRFVAISQLMKELSIEADFRLPDNQQAFKILCELT